MRRGRPKRIVELTTEQREELLRWTRRPTTAQALALRARIILACAEGGDDVEVAARLGIIRDTVGRWRRRFVEHGADGLLDEPRPGAPRKISDRDVERVITMTLETKPRDATHWSTRSMAKAVGMSQSAVSRIWRAFALQPHRQDTFKLSKDPLFVEKVRDIVGLYLNPPDREWCFVSTRSRRSRRWTEHNLCCPYSLGCLSVERMTTCATVRHHRCSLHSISRAARSSASCIVATAHKSSKNS